MVIVSGGQSGADLGAWRAAQALSLPTRGWMPLGYITEDGPKPDYAKRTRLNVRDSSASLWFGDPDSPGGQTTLRACVELGRPALKVAEGITKPSDVVRWIHQHDWQSLNCAGNRESKAPRIGDQVERFMLRVLRRLNLDDLPFDLT